MKSSSRSSSDMTELLGGDAISYETAVNLRRIVYGTSVHSFSSDWRKLAFNFQDPDTPYPFGLHAQRNGTRGLVMCVQTFIIKRLVFKYDTKEEIFRRNVLRPTKYQQREALVHALSEMLWRTGEKRVASVCVTQATECFSASFDYKKDGVTEKLRQFTFHSLESLMMFLKRNLSQMETPGGGILFLYSLVLSRSIAGVRTDMGGHAHHDQLVTDMEECSTALLNLALTGRATPYLHNGDVIFSEAGNLLAKPLLGVAERSEVGLLHFHKDEHKDRRTQVGSMLKTPRKPIWLTHVNGAVTGLLFSTNPDLMSDWRTEHHFTLHYYTGLTRQTKDVVLTVDTRFSRQMAHKKTSTSRHEEEKRIPSLEQLVMSKWPGATVDWNGTQPFV